MPNLKFKNFSTYGLIGSLYPQGSWFPWMWIYASSCYRQRNRKLEVGKRMHQAINHQTEERKRQCHKTVGERKGAKGRGPQAYNWAFWLMVETSSRLWWERLCYTFIMSCTGKGEIDNPRFVFQLKQSYKCLQRKGETMLTKVRFQP